MINNVIPINSNGRTAVSTTPNLIMYRINSFITVSFLAAIKPFSHDEFIISPCCIGLVNSELVFVYVKFTANFKFIKLDNTDKYLHSIRLSYESLLVLFLIE